jgi:C-methyltransferase
MDNKTYLKSFFTGYWSYMAVATACELNLFQHLITPRSTKALSKIMLVKENELNLLLNALCNLNFLTKSGNMFELNELSSYLTDDHPESLKEACLNWHAEHLTAWQKLSYTIRTGNSAFNMLYGDAFFDYISKQPHKLNAYHKAMNAYATDDYKMLPEKFNFSSFDTIIDVGGGYGALISTIKKQYPKTNCILFDLPNVIENVTVNEISKIPGNFFQYIPPGNDILILARVLHDWNDEKAQLILKNTFDALNENGKLLVIENCTDKIDGDISLLSLNMALMCQSYERSSIEYNDLAVNTGFKLENSIPLNSLQTILIYSK